MLSISKREREREYSFLRHLAECGEGGGGGETGKNRKEDEHRSPSTPALRNASASSSVLGRPFSPPSFAAAQSLPTPSLPIFSSSCPLCALSRTGGGKRLHAAVLTRIHHCLFSWGVLCVVSGGRAVRERGGKILPGRAAVLPGGDSPFRPGWAGMPP